MQGLICFESVMQGAAARGIVSDGAPVICKPSRKVSVAGLCRVRDSTCDAIYYVRPDMTVPIEGLFVSYKAPCPTCILLVRKAAGYCSSRLVATPCRSMPLWMQQSVPIPTLYWASQHAVVQPVLMPDAHDS